MPGQLGPINIDSLSFNTALTFTISNTAIPSVIQTINLISAYIASRIASAANAAGTNITLASISWLSIAERTVS